LRTGDSAVGALPAGDFAFPPQPQEPAGRYLCISRSPTNSLYNWSSFNTNNRIASTTVNSATFTYDAAGNMTSDGSHTYTYDAEGNITKVDSGTTAAYLYDALNHRVRTTVGTAQTEFVFNRNGQRVSVWNASNNTVERDQYYWGNTPVAFANGGSVHFQHQDWLGTERTRTTYNGSVEGTYTSLPFGDGYAPSGSDQDPYHYAQLDYDSETATSHAQYRQDSTTQGRWMSPDPYYGSYDPYNPQSLNRYSYALNSPLTYSDPSGLLVQIGNCVYAELVTDVTIKDQDGNVIGTGGGETYGLEFLFCGSAGGGGVIGGVGGGGGAPNNGPQVSQLACKAAYTAGGAAAGALVGAPVGGVVGGVVGGAAGGAGGTVVAPGVGTVVLGAAGAEAGAATGSTAGAWLGGLVGGLAGNALGNIMCSSGTGGGGNYQPNQSHCDAQLEADLNVCRASKSRACYAQAYVRHDVCSRGLPVPPLNF